METIIRPAAESDLEAITEIYNQAILTGKATGHTELQNAKDKLPWFRSHSVEKYPLLVAETSDRIAGWLSLSPYREGREAFSFTAEVSYYVHRDFQRRGIASMLMEKAFAHGRKSGIHTLVAFLLAHNIPSIAFLKKFGFTLCGTLPKIAHINGREFDHVFYGKRLF